MRRTRRTYVYTQMALNETAPTLTGPSSGDMPYNPGAAGGHLEWSIAVAISCQGVGAEASASITCVMTIIG